MKRGIAFILSLFLLDFVSAQIFGGYGNYGSFSITGLFDSISSQDLILVTLFIIFFAFFFVVLTRTSIFKREKATPWGRVSESDKSIPAVISIAMSLLTIYGIYKSGFSLEELFYGFGFSAETLYPFIWIILIAAAVFIIWKLGIGIFFLALGSLMIIVAIFTDLIYEKTTALVIGLILLIIGIFLTKTARKWWKRNVRTY